MAGGKDPAPRSPRCACSTAELPAGRARAVAIGNFDGVHRGHLAVIDAARSAALEQGLTLTVLTFDPHPRTVFGQTVPLLCSLRRRVELLGEVGVEEVLTLPFDRRVAAVPADRWAQRTLGAIDARFVAVGANFRFGRARGGDPALLRRLGFETEAVGLLDGISSSAIRAEIAAGHFGTAATMLGRPVELEGRVRGLARSGDGRREHLDLVPTIDNPAWPPLGRYRPLGGGADAVTVWRSRSGRHLGVEGASAGHRLGALVTVELAPTGDTAPIPETTWEPESEAEAAYAAPFGL